MKIGLVMRFNRRAGQGVVRTMDGTQCTFRAAQQTPFTNGQLVQTMHQVLQITPRVGDEICFVVGPEPGQVDLWNYSNQLPPVTTK